MTHTYLRGDVYELPFKDGQVDTIITDPPWHYETRVVGSKAVAAADFAMIRDEEWRGASPVLNLDANGHQVATLRPTPLTEMYRVLKPGGHLYVFVPERKLQMALESFTGPLGLTPDSDFKLTDRFLHFNTIVWVKSRQDGVGIRMGLGHTYRQSMELVLCFSKGFRRPLQAHNVPNVLEFPGEDDESYALRAPPEGGSRKPAALYSAIAKASTPTGGLIIDPFAGTDPLGRAVLDEYETVSLDIDPPVDAEAQVAEAQVVARANRALV